MLLHLPPIRTAAHGWYPLHRIEGGITSGALGALEVELFGCAVTAMPARVPDAGPRAIQARSKENHKCLLFEEKI